jgi:hypothetical protein
MWPYFDLDNSGAMDMEEFLMFAEGKDSATNSLPSIGGRAPRRNKHVLASIAKAQRPLLEENPAAEREMSPPTDEHVQDLLKKPVWSVTQVRQQVSLLPLPSPVIAMQEDWLLDITKHIPGSAQEWKEQKRSPKRNWRGTFFQQVKQDTHLRPRSRLHGRPVSSPCSPLSPPNAKGVWDHYRQERQSLFDGQREKEKVKQKKIQDTIEKIDEAQRVLSDIESDRKEMLGF